MQYAQVYVDRKMSKLSQLYYQIPPKLLPDIQVGALVDVPLRGHSTRGIIANLSSHKPSDISLKDIISVKSAGPVVDQLQLDYYSSIARHTLSSLEDTLFYFLPKKVRFVPYCLPTRPLTKKTGQIKTITGTTKERFDRYLKLTQTFSGSLLFIFPDFVSLNSFAQQLGSKKYLVYSGQSTPTKRWEMYNLINVKKNIILATRSGIGLIPKNPYLVIIDNPSHPGYKEDRRPKFQIEEIIPLRLKLGDRIVIGINYPNIRETYLYKQVFPKNSLKIQLRTGQKNVLDGLTEEITEAKTILVAIPQKGQWGILICKACATVLRCSKCNSPLKQIKDNELYCTSCQEKINGFPACGNCQTHNYTGYSIGTRQIENELKKSHPDKTIIRLDKTSKIDSAMTISDNSIVIATHMILDVYLPKFDQVICLGFDPLLDIVRFDQEEKIALTLHNFLNLGLKGQIVTSRPEHRVYHGIANNSLGDLLSAISRERGSKLPPYARLVTIESKTEFKPEDLKNIQELSLLPVQTSQSKNKFNLNITVSRNNWSKLVDLAYNRNADLTFNPEPRDYNL